MIANLLVLLLVIGLAVLFGWLCYRAIRARRLWVKIVGGIGAGLLTLVCSSPSPSWAPRASRRSTSPARAPRRI